MASHRYELTVVPRGAVELPLPLPEPEGFKPSDPRTWPVLAGRLEYVGERLLFMPPCGDQQQKVAVDVVTELNLWRRAHPEFVVGGNEAGMMLGGEVRAADAAVWKRDELAPDSGGFPRVAPVLAVEVAGKDEDAEALKEKAGWYLQNGVEVVWILAPPERLVHVVTRQGTSTANPGGSIPRHPALPGLSPSVPALFQQLAD